MSFLSFSNSKSSDEEVLMKYDVYGVGNALVDMEFHVTPEFLKKMNIEKGLMTLVDEDRQKVLMEGLKNLKPLMRSGGSAANTMIAIAQFGGKAFYSYKVARDEYGAFYLKDLQANGVVTKVSEHQLGITGKCLVMITPDADRTMNTFLGITESFSVEELDEEAIKESRWLYVEGYLVASPTGRPASVYAMNLAKKHGVKTALTFSDPNMIKFFREVMNEMLGDGIDLLFCNEDEALTYAQKAKVEEAAETIKKIAKQFVITLGPRGALVYDGKEITYVSGLDVKAVDTNGAGDMFAGAFLYAYTQGSNFRSSAEFACKASSIVVTHHGARLEKAQAEDVKKEYYHGR